MVFVKWQAVMDISRLILNLEISLEIANCDLVLDLEDIGLGLDLDLGASVIGITNILF